MNDTIKIIRATEKDIYTIVELVVKLLNGFNLSGHGHFNIDKKMLETATKEFLTKSNFAAFIALNSNKTPIGLITIAEGFAIYNGGDFGVITELYVEDHYRSKGLGKLLLASVFEFATSRNWKKIEVGAPNASEWPRTIAFYKKNGFKEKGPKLRIELKNS